MKSWDERPPDQVFKQCPLVHLATNSYKNSCRDERGLGSTGLCFSSSLDKVYCKSPVSKLDQELGYLRSDMHSIPRPVGVDEAALANREFSAHRQVPMHGQVSGEFTRLCHCS